MVYERRIVGAKAGPDGNTVLRVQDGSRKFEVEVMDYGFRRVDTRRKVKTLINPEKVDFNVHVLEGAHREMVLCLGKLIPQEKVHMRTRTLVGHGIPFEHDEMFNIREIPKTVGDMGFCVLGIHEHMVDVGPIFVPEVYRGFGLARRLLGEAEKIARREGKAVLESWVLKKNNDSNLLFESMGYTRTDPRPRGDTYQWVKKMGEAE